MMHINVWLYTGLFCNMLWCMVTLPVTAKDTYKYIITGNRTKYRFENGTTRYCKSILHPNYCGIGHEIFPCLRDGEQDRCERCQDGYANLDPTTSDLQNRCYIFSCPENTIQVENVSDPGCNLPCICDQTAGYFGKNGCLCSHVNFECGPDTFLSGGVCTACPPGTYKPGRGYGPCIPAESTQDYSTTTKATTQPPTSVLAHTTKSSEISTNVAMTPDSEPGEPVKQSLLQGQIATIVIVSTLFVVVLGLGIFLIRRSQEGTEILDAEYGSPVNPERGTLITKEVLDAEYGSPVNPERGTLITKEDDSEDSDAIPNPGGIPAPPVQPIPEQPSPLDPNPAMFNIAFIFPKADEELAYRIKEELNRMVLNDRRKVKTWDFNDPAFGGSKLEFPRQFTSVCPLTLVLLTCNTSKDIDCKYMIEEAIALTRLGEEERQRYCVRPLHTIPEDKRTYGIPAGLDSVSAVEWGRRNLQELLNYLSDAETASEKSGSATSDSPLLNS